MVGDEVVEKLRRLGVFPDTEKNPNSVRENAEIFHRCATLNGIDQECGSRHWGCGGGQFVYFHLEALLKSDSSYKSRFLEEAKHQLDGLGISPEHIEEYYQSEANPGLAFTLRHEEQYGADVRMPFFQKADQFAINKMREWLGFKQRC